MKWVSVNNELPKASGAYIVSIKKEGASGVWVFEYVAWFHEPGKKWLKYDPFEDSALNTFKGDITSLVVGWVADVPSFIGNT